MNSKNEKIKQKGDEIDISLFRKNNADKWMRYEDDITRYYYPKVLEWINSKDRKHSQVAFTAGLGRNIARLVETGETNAIRKVGEWMRNELYYYVTPLTKDTIFKKFNKKFGVEGGEKL